MTRGKYIVIEGPEGVGKSTQVSLLADKLRAAGLPVRLFREPDSQSDVTARSIRQLTQDQHYPMNTKTEVLLYNAARSQSLDVIRSSVENGVYCIVDRNFLSTLALQYYGRGNIPDYQTIETIIDFSVGDNYPDLTIVLDAPATVLKQRSDERNGGERFDNLDEAFLERVRAGYLLEAKKRSYPVVFSTNNPEEVSVQIWSLVTPILAARQSPENETHAQSIKEVLQQKSTQLSEPPFLVQTESESPQNGPLVIKDEANVFYITDAGQQYLEHIVTSSKGSVYSFYETFSPVTAAAAMARLSRRGDDLRVTLLDEFSQAKGKDDALLKRVITAYGDDSVQQLVGLHFVVEGASNLLSKQLEWGRLASYLEQSTRYIFYDQKDSAGNYSYYVPTTLPAKTAKDYRRAMDALFGLYSSMVRELTEYIRHNSSTLEKERDGAWKSATKAQACDAVRPVLPVATKSTVGIYASGQALEALIMRLRASESTEANLAGDDILREARKVIPTFLERADLPERGGAFSAYMKENSQAMSKLATAYLKSSYSSDFNPVTLKKVWPANELDLVPYMLYDQTSLSLNELESEVAGWSMSKKLKVFSAYIGKRLNRRQKPGRALEHAHYTWDIMCDYGIFRDMQRHRMVDDLRWQALTPRYGYDIPELVEEAGLAESFEKCFDLATALYSKLQADGFVYEAQYATLLGHRMRWTVTYNAREAFHLHELRTSPQGHPEYRKLMQKMHEELAQKHPMLAEAMQFVNQDEDPELTRLAAERATQYKLEKLRDPK